MTPNLWLERLASSSLQGLAFLLVIWAICRLAKNLRPQTRQWLWWLGSLKLIVGLVWTLTLTLPAHDPESTSPIHRFLPEPGTAAHAATHQTAANPSLNVPVILLILWLIGVSFFALRFLREMRTLAKLLRRATNASDSASGQTVRRIALEMGISSPPRVVLSSEITSPLVALPLRPTIVLPQDFEQALTPDEQEMALAHELAHLKRLDLWTSIVPTVARALFFFLPPVWIAAREFGADAEASCDEEAINATGGAKKRYCELLVKMVARDSRPVSLPALGATHQFHTLKRRIELMRNGAIPSAKVAAAAFAIALLFAIPFRVEAGQKAAAFRSKTIANASFEEGIKTPAGWEINRAIPGVQYRWDRNVAHSGRASLAIVKTAQRYFPIAQWRQTLARYDGVSRKLDLSAWVKARQAHKSILDVEFESTDGKFSHQWAAYIGAEQDGDSPANHNWRLYRGTVDIPENTRNVTICLETYGPGTAWFDDVQATFHN